MNWLQRQAFRLRAGAKVEYFGKVTGEYVIRFKGIYISVLENEDSYSVSWSADPTMFHVPIREFWEANPPSRPPEYDTGRNDGI